jgi:glycosyltransferase involved in cell wall biosynthesis
LFPIPAVLCRYDSRRKLDSVGSPDSLAAKILAVIPARDEEGSVGTVVAGLLSAGIRHVRVIDNGSSDRTSTVASSAGAEVLREPVAGYGRACWRGLQNLPAGVEWVLFCDEESLAIAAAVGSMAVEVVGSLDTFDLKKAAFRAQWVRRRQIIFEIE